MLAKIEVLHGLSNIDFHSSKTSLASATAMTPICNITINQFWAADMALFPTWSVGQLVSDWLHRTTSIKKVAIFATFVSLWNRHFLWIWIYFPWPQCFCQNHYLRTYGMFICCHVFLHNIDYNQNKAKQRTPLIASKVRQWAHAHEIY